MNDLIARLEKASVPDRALEAAIARTVGEEMPRDPVGWPPRYMESIDAALTLVPKRDMLVWSLWDSHGSYASRVVIGGGGWVDDHELGSASGAPTPAIALCIAALKARLLHIHK